MRFSFHYDYCLVIAYASSFLAACPVTRRGPHGGKNFPFEQGQPATVVPADALVFSDNRWMGRIFDILNRAAQNVQVIVFTCRKQLFENLGGRPLSLELANGEELASA